jgi:hypothetical protein
VEFSDGSTDSIQLIILSQHKRNLTGRFIQGDGQNAQLVGTVDLNGTVRFKYHGGGGSPSVAGSLPRFHGAGSGQVSKAATEIDAVFTTQESGRTVMGSFVVEEQTGTP